MRKNKIINFLMIFYTFHEIDVKTFLNFFINNFSVNITTIYIYIYIYRHIKGYHHKYETSSFHIYNIER